MWEQNEDFIDLLIYTNDLLCQKHSFKKMNIMFKKKAKVQCQLCQFRHQWNSF